MKFTYLFIFIRYVSILNHVTFFKVLEMHPGLHVKMFVCVLSLTADASVSSEHGDQCALCTEGGELLCCDTCPLAYHLACAYPPLRRIPRGNWACQVCTGADDERPRSSRVKKATIEGTNKKNPFCPMLSTTFPSFLFHQYVIV